MIRLVATRVHAYGAFEFSIAVPGKPGFLTRNPRKIASLLCELGVKNSEVLVEHVKMWGVVEIVPPISPREKEPFER